MAEQDFSVTPKVAKINYASATALPHLPMQASLVAGNSGAPPSAGPEQTEVPPPVAMLVCHGMGQQVRFETLGQIAASVLKQAQAQGCTIDQSSVELSLQKNSFLARAELHWIKPDGVPHSVHIYEAYWAPVTEGKVTYWDTVKFLSSAAWAGIRSSRFLRPCDFDRYLFGGLRKLTISRWTMIGLLITAAFLAAQVIAIAIVLAKIADQLKQIETARFAINQIVIILFPGLHTLFNHNLTGREHLFAALALVGWYLLVAEILFVRSFLIQYAGDVAAYISPYKSSKFQGIRDRIQAIGLNVAKVIYGFDNQTPVPDYPRVVIVGHSLGSVLAYDTLNAVINLDETSPVRHARNVFERTTRLITFGSPLDKTAFLFRNQSNHVQDPLREQMASSLQPLILDYDAFRKPHFWTNLHSPKDIISGALDYYDLPTLPDTDPMHISNIEDPACTIPFYAHVQYWTGALLARTLYDAVK